MIKIKPAAAILRQEAKHYSKASGQFRCSQENREGLTHSNAFASFLSTLEMFPSAHDEHEPDHDAQQKQRNIGETSQLRDDQD